MQATAKSPHKALSAARALTAVFRGCTHWFKFHLAAELLSAGITKIKFAGEREI
jgi:hypothetical protein